MHKNTINSENAKYMRYATYASVFVATILIIVKFYAWILTDSVSLMASLADSALDLVISLINLFAVRYALLPPDEDHKFGHTGAEDLAALTQAAFVAGSSVFIAVWAFGRSTDSHEIEHSSLGIAVMVFSIILTYALITFQKWVIKKTKSTAIEADSLHYMGDLLMNASVIIAIILSTYFGLTMADPVFAILIAIYIFYGAWNIGKIAFDKLMDKEFEEDEKQKIIDFVLAQKEVKGIHELKTRYSGIKPFIQFHLELDGNLKLVQAHEIADAIEQSLKELFPGGEVIIHEDPV